MNGTTSNAVNMVDEDLAFDILDDDAVAVVVMSDTDDDALFSTQQTVSGELSAGRDVVLVCEARLARHIDRITVASMAFRGCGRFAVVSPDSAELMGTIPPSMAARLNVFATQDEAMTWMRPQSSSIRETLLYFTLN